MRYRGGCWCSSRVIESPVYRDFCAVRGLLFFFFLLCVVGVLELWETSYERGPGSLDGGVALFFRLGELKVAACQKELRAMRAGLCQRRMGR